MALQLVQDDQTTSMTVNATAGARAFTKCTLGGQRMLFRRTVKLSNTQWINLFATPQTLIPAIPNAIITLISAEVSARGTPTVPALGGANTINGVPGFAAPATSGASAGAAFSPLTLNGGGLVQIGYTNANPVIVPQTLCSANFGIGGTKNMDYEYTLFTEATDAGNNALQFVNQPIAIARLTANNTGGAATNVFTINVTYEVRFVVLDS